MNARALRNGFLMVVGSLLLGFSAKAQADAPDHDTTYYESLKHLLTGRFYFSKKYTTLELGGAGGRAGVLYRPNTTVNMGIGATYQSLSLNLAYGFQFLNQHPEKGETRYLDLQSHLYGRKWTIDLFGQFYKGYYLSPKGFAALNPESYYLRPDIRVHLLGAAVFRVFNERRFSYPAAFIQSEWQRKSAGSFIAGGEMYYGFSTGDSAFIPTVLAGHYPQRGIKTMRFIEFGPGAGYAYTWVIGQRLFLTGSFTLNMDLGFTREYSDSAMRNYFGISPNVIYRMVVGYNSRRWNYNFSIVNNSVTARGAASEHPYQIQTGNFRLTIAHRFDPGPRLKKRLRLLDRLLLNK